MKQKILYVILIVLLAKISLANTVTVKIFDSEIKVSTRSQWEQTFKFASGDTISVEISTLEGDDISKFELRKWGGSTVISRIAKEKVNEKYYNPKEAAYTFYLENSAMLQNKTYKINIYRTTQKDSLIDFDVTFRADTLVDTSFVEILNTTHELASGMGASMGYNDRIEIPFQIPEDCTDDLCYIVGTKSAFNKMWETIGGLAKAVSFPNPLHAILVHAVTNIPKVTSSEGYIEYYLVDSENLSRYRGNKRFNCIKRGENTTAEVARVNLKEDNPLLKTSKSKYYYFIIVNPAMTHSRIVSIKATAMKIKKKIIPK